MVTNTRVPEKAAVPSVFLKCDGRPNVCGSTTFQAPFHAPSPTSADLHAPADGGRQPSDPRFPTAGALRPTLIGKVQVKKMVATGKTEHNNPQNKLGISNFRTKLPLYSLLFPFYMCETISPPWFNGPAVPLLPVGFSAEWPRWAQSRWMCRTPKALPTSPAT